MLLVYVLCAGVLAPRPGCIERRVPLVVDVLPAGCAEVVQADLAARTDLDAGAGAVVRYGCRRRRSRQAEAE